MRRGFTLVELSIVLVIIGLLIGGILVAQSMIGTARISNTVRTLARYEISVANFQTKFQQLPGDDNLFPAPTGELGAKDGLIGNAGTWPLILTELGRAWPSLSQGIGIKNFQGNDFTTFSSFTLGTSIVEANCPRLDLPQYPFKANNDITCLLIISNSVANGTNTSPTNTNRFWYGIYKGKQPGNGSYNDPLTSIDTMAIDTKMDDGLPATGIFKGLKFGVSTPAQCNLSGKYNLTSSDFICSFTLELNKI